MTDDTPPIEKHAPSGGAAVTLYRPVGAAELSLIEGSGYTRFPPRLPEQPIFYPVTNQGYAEQIARDWNTKEPSGKGFVTRFEVCADHLAQYQPKIVGGSTHEEYWIPAEALEAFNDAIVGGIKVVARFERGGEP